jgi:hypothetical protein
MAGPGILTGGNGKSLFRSNPNKGNATPRMGIYATNPGATPKYARNRGRRDAEYSDTIARLYIELPSTLNIQDFLNGLPEETRALGEVLAHGGSTGGTGGTGFIDFAITSAQESFTEKTQIVNTLTDNYVAFYAGQEAPLFNYSGTVLNTYQDDQRVWLLRLYRDILRGTRLAQRGLIASLRYDSFIVHGYLENLVMTIQSATQMSGQFNFSFRVKEMVIHTPSLSLPTISNNLSVGVLPAQTVSEASTSNARTATVTSDMAPTAQSQPAAISGEDDTVIMSQLDEPPQDEIQEFRAELINQSFFPASGQDAVADANSSIAVSQFDLANATSSPTKDGIAGLSNVWNPNSVVNAAQFLSSADPTLQTISIATSTVSTITEPGARPKPNPTLADTFMATARIQRVPARNRGASKVTPPATYIYEEASIASTPNTTIIDFTGTAEEFRQKYPELAKRQDEIAKQFGRIGHHGT